MAFELMVLWQVDAVEAQWTQRETEAMQERGESRKLAALFQKVAATFRNSVASISDFP